METIDPMRFVFASFFVLGLLGLFALGLKKYSEKSFGGKIFSVTQGQGRIAIVETRYLDHKSKLLLVKRDNVEHLLLISEGTVTVVESGIKHEA